MSKPLVVDGFCGLGGWAEGFLAEDYTVVGFDIKRHDYGTGGYPAQLVLQDWLTLDGRQFKDAACIVCSPPCQEFSYMAMPWSRAKHIARALRGEDEFPEKYEGSRTTAELTALFDACFRIQIEASAAAGRHIPLVVENVKGAQPWVGPAKAHYGSFYLWGDVESVGGAVVGIRPKFGEVLRTTPRARKFNPDGTEHPQGSWFAVADSKNRGEKLPGNNGPRMWSEREVQRLCDAPPLTGTKNDGSGWLENGTLASCNRMVPDGRKQPQGGSWFGDYKAQKAELIEGTKCGGDWFNDEQPSLSRLYSSKSTARQAASAQIAKIPFPLARHIARIYKP